MKNDEIKIQLEELGIEQSFIENIVSKISNGEKPTFTADQVEKLQEIDLKNKISREKDWRERTSLAAQIVSLHLI